MKRILWVSKHQPIQTQVDELKRLFGPDVTIDIHEAPYASAFEVISLFKKGYYDEMVVIAPLGVCKILTECGYQPLYCEMESSKGNHNSEVKVFNDRDRINRTPRYFGFKKFKRLERVELTFSELEH